MQFMHSRRDLRPQQALVVENLTNAQPGIETGKCQFNSAGRMHSDYSEIELPN
jgi:hypothetical protein